MGGVSIIMDIIWGVESWLILKTFPDNKVNIMYIEISPNNNNIFVIRSIYLNSRVWYIHSRKFFQNHVGHESDTNSVFFFPMEMPLALDQMTPPVF